MCCNLTTYFVCQKQSSRFEFGPVWQAVLWRGTSKAVLQRSLGSIYYRNKTLCSWIGPTNASFLWPTFSSNTVLLDHSLNDLISFGSSILSNTFVSLHLVTGYLNIRWYYFWILCSSLNFPTDIFSCHSKQHSIWISSVSCTLSCSTM